MAKSDRTTLSSDREGDAASAAVTRPAGLGCFSWRRQGPRLWCIFVLLLLIALVPLLLLQVDSLYGEYRDRRVAALRREEEAARKAGALLDMHLAEAREDGATLAQPFLQSPTLPRSEWNSLLARFVVEHYTLRSLTWVDGNGHILATSDPERVGEHPERLPWSGTRSAPRAWSISNLVARTGTFFVASQVYDPSGVWRGVMVTEVAPDVLMEHVLPSSMGNGTFTVLDAGGRQVYRYPADSEAPSPDSLAAHALRTGRVQIATGDDPTCPERAFCVAVPLPHLGWTVIMTRPEAELARPIVFGLLQEGAVFAFVALGAFLIAAAVAGRVSARWRPSANSPKPSVGARFRRTRSPAGRGKFAA